MSNRRIFHLSIPVHDLEIAMEFYTETLGADSGRATDSWADALLWGHQITLQLRPDEVLPAEKQGKRHFGVVLPWNDWIYEEQRLRHLGAEFLSEPALHQEGTSNEHCKMYLSDPSDNVIEIKAYRDVQHTLGLPEIGT